MILLDTNVVSALMLREPDPVVVSWMNRQRPEDLWLSSVAAFEIQHGIELLPAAAKRKALESVFETMLVEDFGGRVLPFDTASALRASSLAAERRRQGRPVDFRDTFIAGIALAHGATLATRNIRHFADAGVPLLSPWGLA